MKKLTLIALAFIFVCQYSFSQCNYPVFPEPTHVKIQTDQTIDATGVIYWICENVTLTVSSSTGSAYYLEENANLIINGSDGDFAAMEAGSTLTNNSDANVTVAANSTNVTMNNTGGGTVTVTFECEEVTIDPTLSGSTSCNGTDGVDEILLEDLSIYPNPSESGMTVNVNYTRLEVDIYNAFGQLIDEQKIEDGLIITNNLSSGYYYLFIETDQGRAIKTLMIH